MDTSNVVPVERPRREPRGAVLAMNLLAARVAAGMTQQALAQAADVSRATIAQLEAGLGDPRLSTVGNLAAALNVSPLLLLAGGCETAALVRLHEGPATPPPAIRSSDAERMAHLASTGLLKDRLRAAELGAAIAREANAPPPAVVAAAVLSPILPVAGTRLGIRLYPEPSRD